MSNSDFELPPDARSSKPGIRSNTKKEAAQTSSSNEAENKADNKNEDKSADDVKTPTYSQEELLRVFDELIFQNEYTEEVLIRSNFKAVFRTRTSEEITAIQDSIDKAGFTLISSVENAKQIQNLIYGLVSLKGKPLPTSFAEKEKIVANLPGPVVGMLLQALFKFDQKVILACTEGEANF